MLIASDGSGLLRGGLVRLVACVCLVVLGGALGGVGLLTSASSSGHVWVAAPSGMGSGVVVYHVAVPSGSGEGWDAVRPALRLDHQPAALAASGDELFVVMGGGGGRDVASVRRLEVSRDVSRGWVYSSLRVVPPISLSGGGVGGGDEGGAEGGDGEGDLDLEGDAGSGAGVSRGTGRVVDLACARAVGGRGGRGGRVVAALIGWGDVRELRVLGLEGWRVLELPGLGGGEVGGEVRLVGDGERLVVVARSGARGVRVWWAGAGAVLDAVSSGEPVAWRGWDAEVPIGEFEVVSAGGQLVSVSGVRGDGRRGVSVLREGASGLGVVEIEADARVSRGFFGVDGGFGVLEVEREGAGAGDAEVDGDADGDGGAGVGTGRTMWVRVWTLGGGSVFSGEVEAVGPVSPGEMGLLSLMLLSLFVSVLVFVSRPALTWNPAVVLPAGSSLAPPGRRLMAFAVDLAPGMFAASVLFPSEGGGVGLFGVPLVGGVMPLVVVMVVTGSHMAFGEALGGRTLGKLVMGLRTVGVDGERPGLWASVARSVVKVLCPPLMMFTLASPYMPGPAGFGTVVVVDGGGDGEGGEERDGGD